MAEVVGGHDLVVGGSGMLAGLCLALAGAGRRVSVVGRDPARLDRLAAAPGIRPLAVDYRGPRSAGNGARRGRRRRRADRAGRVLDPSCRGARRRWRIAQRAGRLFVTYWAAPPADPARPDLVASWRNRVLQARPGLAYRTVILGFVPGSAGCAVALAQP